MNGWRLGGMNGWRLTGVLSLLLAAMALYFLVAHNWNVDGIRLVIRATARTSLMLFVLAFTASAMVELLPSDGTRWQRRRCASSRTATGA